MRPIAFTFVLWTAVVAQVLPPAPPPPPPAPAATQEKGAPTFRTETQLVVVNVSAKDKDGKFLDNLKASDFTVTEDGKAQQIKVFELQHLEDTVLPPAPLPTLEPKSKTKDEAPAQPPVKPMVAATFAPAPPGQVKYRDRRLLVLFFDLAGMPIADQLRTQKSAEKFISTQMTEADMVAMMSYTTDINIIQDFTNDRDLLLKEIKSLSVNDNGMADGSTGAENEADSGTAYQQDDSEFNLFNTDRKLAALENTAKMLGGMPEKKALVYFASGMSRNGADNQAQLSATINAAVRNNVVFYPVDARGLQAQAPVGDATKASPGGSGVFTGNAMRSQQSQFQGQQETLYALASDTGGKALLDSNDLAQGVVQAQQDISSYYILGYYSSNAKQDGKYRRIKVDFVNKTLGAKLDYRTGYYAGKDFKQFTSSDRDLQLQEALQLGDPITDLGIALEVNYFRMARDRYFVPVSVKIPGGDIELARSGGKESTRLDFIGEVRDAKNALQGTVRDYIKVDLKGDKASELAKRNLAYDTGFTLPPGTYKLKFLARENETGKMGTYETKFVIPDLSNPMPTLPVSSVVLSYQREKLDAMVASAIKDTKLMNANPLIQNDQKLIPSVTRVFRRDQNMYVYLEAYQPDATATQFMIASVAFFRGKTKAFETTPLEIREGLDTRSKAVPVRFSVPLASLEPGRYTIQITVLNPETNKFAVQRASVILLPALAQQTAAPVAAKAVAR